MITVTQRAKEELKRILSAKVDNPQAGMRLSTSGPSEFVLGIDVEKPGDQVVKHKGSKVLLVGEVLAASLKGHTLDFTGAAEGQNFVVSKEK